MFPSQKAASLEARDAFANGLISLEELDERLEKIASSENHTDAFAAITDLQIENEKIRQDAARQECADLAARASSVSAGPLLAVIALTAMVTLVWGVFALAGSDAGFWPAWMGIPLTVAAAVYLIRGWAEKRTCAKESRQPESW